MKYKSVIALPLALTLLLTACGGGDSPVSSPASGMSAPPVTSPLADPVEADGRLRVGLSHGLPGLGMTELVERAEELVPCLLTLEQEQEVADQLLDGRLDGALVSPVAGLELYHQSGGTLCIVAALTVELPAEQKLWPALGLPDAWEEEVPVVGSVLMLSTRTLGERSVEWANLLARCQHSLEQALAHPEQAGKGMEQMGLVADGTLPTRILTQCQPVLVQGPTMAAALTSFYECLFRLDPTALSGGLPDDGIYYLS